MSEYVSKDACDNCQKFFTEKIEGVEKRANLLLGTTTATIILSIIQFLIIVKG